MTSSAAWTFALHASRACCAAVLAGSVVTEGDGLDTAVLGACDSALVVLDSACGPAVVALGQNFTAANEPPTRSAAAIASGMMTRAGWAFARRACTTFPPKDSPVPLTYSKMLGGANCELPCETSKEARELTVEECEPGGRKLSPRRRPRTVARKCQCSPGGFHLRICCGRNQVWTCCMWIATPVSSGGLPVRTASSWCSSVRPRVWWISTQTSKRRCRRWPAPAWCRRSD